MTASARLLGLVDCNAFYASCEQVFDPSLRGRAVVVASGVDGCAVAASPQARAMGVTTGAPMFRFRDQIDAGRLVLRAANFALYGDLSRRVMAVLARSTPRREVYSIDEAFCDWTGEHDVAAHAQAVRQQVWKWTGIPVSIGVAETRVLAKLANRLAKRYRGLQGVCVLPDEPRRSTALEQVEIGDVWGCGPALATRLHRRGVRTARDLRALNPEPLVPELGIAVERLVHGLRGIETEAPPRPGGGRQSLTVSRTFTHDVGDLDTLQRAAARFATKAMERLRAQGGQAASLRLLLGGNRHRDGSPADRVLDKRWSPPTDLTAEALYAVREMVVEAHQDGLRWKRLGITLSEISAAGSAQQAVLFDPIDRSRANRLQSTVDDLNRRLGRDVIRPGSVGETGSAGVTAERSPAWTTQWDALPSVSALAESS